MNEERNTTTPLEELALRVGARLVIEPPEGSSGVSPHLGRVGDVRPPHLVVPVPSDEVGQQLLGHLVRCHSVDEGRVLEFPARVEELVPGTPGHLLLRPQHAVPRVERRRHRRVAVDLDVTVTGPDGRVRDGILRDLSVVGARVEVDGGAVDGDVWGLAWELDGEPLEATVVTVAGSSTEVRGDFLWLPDHCRRALLAHVRRNP